MRNPEASIRTCTECHVAEEANWAACALKVFQITSRGQREFSLSDLLCGLMHWSDQNEFDFDGALHAARARYTDEANGN